MVFFFLISSGHGPNSTLAFVSSWKLKVKKNNGSTTTSSFTSFNTISYRMRQF